MRIVEIFTNSFLVYEFKDLLVLIILMTTTKVNPLGAMLDSKTFLIFCNSQFFEIIGKNNQKWTFPNENGISSL